MFPNAESRAELQDVNAEDVDTETAVDTEADGRQALLKDLSRPKRWHLVLGGWFLLALVAAGATLGVVKGPAIGQIATQDISSADSAVPAIISAGYGCSNWEQIISQPTSATDLAECAATCQDTPGCAQANYQDQACADSATTPGTCYLYTDVCQQEVSKCWTLWTPVSSILPTAEPSGFSYLEGHWPQMPASVGDDLCTEDGYLPSTPETSWSANAMAWTATVGLLCQHTNDFRDDLIQQNLQGAETSPGPIFSELCKKGKRKQVLEPLVGILRDPRFSCDPAPASPHLFSIEWLVMADAQSMQLPSKAKRIFFDAGGSIFPDAMHFFANQYEARGLPFDEIYVWEAQKNDIVFYWDGADDKDRARWGPIVRYYGGTPVTADPNDKANNPVELIKSKCKVEDFCAFKLDIDCPPVELSIVQQLAASPEASARLDEFFFEHHVHGIMEPMYGLTLTQYLNESYAMFTDLRQKGVRAHSWV